MCFPKDNFKLFGLHEQVEWYHFEPMLSNFGPSQGRKDLENGIVWLQTRTKPWFSKKDPIPVAVPKWMNIAHFEHRLSRSHPHSGAYLICR